MYDFVTTAWGEHDPTVEVKRVKATMTKPKHVICAYCGARQNRKRSKCSQCGAQLPK
mgnify:CR=1 FL=1